MGWIRRMKMIMKMIIKMRMVKVTLFYKMTHKMIKNSLIKDLLFLQIISR